MRLERGKEEKRDGVVYGESVIDLVQLSNSARGTFTSAVAAKPFEPGRLLRFNAAVIAVCLFRCKFQPAGDDLIWRDVKDSLKLDCGHADERPLCTITQLTRPRAAAITSRRTGLDLTERRHRRRNSTIKDMHACVSQNVKLELCKF